jgi:hypothetical protein
MWVDNRLSSHSFNDLKLVGQMLTTKSPWWQLQGALGHYGFSTVMGLVYANWGYKRLPGPSWLKGVLLMQVENALLYPAGFVVDRFHAGMKSGQLPPLINRKTFAGQLVRHITFGLALGLLYRPRSR